MTRAPEHGPGTCCPVCGRPPTSTFAEFLDVPVHTNVLWDTRAEAVAAPRGDVVLTLCEGCGLIWNIAFDAHLLEYDAAYENSLHFSPAFQRYAETLADRLIERYAIKNKTVVEIGCGKGEFLTALVESGENSGIGFDPSYDGESDKSSGRVAFVRELYSEASAIGAPDLIVCRHVLEHIQHPLPFLNSIRRAAEVSDAVVYFEVPAAEYLLRQTAVWDIIYAHACVFGEAALRYLFDRAGFRVLDSGFAFADQYLWIEATPRHEPLSHPYESGVDGLGPHVRSLRNAIAEKRAYWGRELADARQNEVVLWGAGAKGTTFLNLIEGAARIGLVVDVNPRKQGMHVPGTGQRIIAPAEVAVHDPRRVIVMNPVYETEIRETLARAGLSPRIESV